MRNDEPFTPESWLRKIQEEYNQLPEHFEVSEEEFQARLKEARETMRGHNWRQRGIEIFCTSCPFQHGFFVTPNEMLVGIENDMPVIKKIKEDKNG